MSKSNQSSPDPRAKIERMVELYTRGIVTERELTSQFVYVLASMRACDVVDDCVTMLPLQVIPGLQAYIAELAARNYPGNPFPYEWRHFGSDDERAACYQEMHLAYHEVGARLEAHWLRTGPQKEGA